MNKKFYVVTLHGKDPYYWSFDPSGLAADRFAILGTQGFLPKKYKSKAGAVQGKKAAARVQQPILNRRDTYLPSGKVSIVSGLSWNDILEEH